MCDYIIGLKTIGLKDISGLHTKPCIWQTHIDKGC